MKQYVKGNFENDIIFLFQVIDLCWRKFYCLNFLTSVIKVFINQRFEKYCEANITLILWKCCAEKLHVKGAFKIKVLLDLNYYFKLKLAFMLIRI